MSLLQTKFTVFEIILGCDSIFFFTHTTSAGVPNVFLTTYPLSILKDEHAPLQFLTTKRLSNITKTYLIFEIGFCFQNYKGRLRFMSQTLICCGRRITAPLQIGKCTPRGTFTPRWNPLLLCLAETKLLWFFCKREWMAEFRLRV